MPSDTPSSIQPLPEIDQQPLPLFVDMDGSLIATDLLWEAVCLGVREDPWLLPRSVRWISQGKAVLKQQLSKRYRPDPRVLPYRQEVLEYLRSERAAGRVLILATASDRVWAQSIADHLQLFDDVLASDGINNLKGSAKLEAINRWCQSRGYEQFAYLGNDRHDFPIWKQAAQRYVAVPSRALLARVTQMGDATGMGQRPSFARAILQVMRPHQWVKNLLVFLPVLLAHRFTDWAGILAACYAFAAMSLYASSVYVVNDLLDIEADRHHASKRRRPFAAGKLPVTVGPPLALALLAGGTFIAWLTLPPICLALLVIYLATTSLYSFWLKRQVMLDVMVLAGLYTLRILVGGAATGTPVSEWLMALSMFLFTSLAFAKRYTELRQLDSELETTVKNRGYRVGDLSLIESMGPTAGYLSVLVLALYIHSGGIGELYPNAQALWLICPLMLYWVSRLWLLAKRGELHDDPVVFAISDRVSYVVAALIVCLALIAMR